MSWMLVLALKVQYFLDSERLTDVERGGSAL
jgi:hypothetical protein